MNRYLTLGQFILLIVLALGNYIPREVVQSWPWSIMVWWWGSLFVACLVVWQLWSDQLVRSASLGGMIVLLGVSYTLGLRAERLPPQLPYGETVDLVGTIDSYPIINDRRQTFYLATAQFGSPTRLRVSTGREPLFGRGATIQIEGKLERPTNSSDFNYADYLETKETYGLISYPTRIEQTNSPTGVHAYLNHLRSQLLAIYRQTLPEPTASLAIGLTLGIQPVIDADLTTALRSTNLTHLAAVSGQNLTLVIVVLFTLIRRWWLRAAIVSTLLLLLVYIGLVGSEPSIVRAATMTSFFLLAPLFGRPTHPLRILLATALVMGLINPLMLTRDIGFQLSFLTFASIVIVSPHLLKRLSWLPDWLATILATTVTAAIAVFPLQLSVFHTLTWTGVLANILVSLVVAVAMGGALILGVIGLLVPQFAQFFAWLLYFPLEFIHQIALQLGHWPHSLTTVDLPPGIGISLVLVEIGGLIWLGWVRSPSLRLRSRWPV